jgi:hypothetical protein
MRREAQHEAAFGEEIKLPACLSCVRHAAIFGVSRPAETVADAEINDMS